MHDDRVVSSIKSGRPSHLQARRRQALRLGTTLSGAAAALLLGSVPAVAAAPSCGVLTLTAITCPASASNPVGIKYFIGNEDAPQDLTVHLAGGISVETGDDYVNGITVGNFSGGTASLIADGASAITTHGAGSIGVAGHTSTGDLTIHIGDVAAKGVEAHGIAAGSVAGAIDVKGGSLTTSGAHSSGIQIAAVRGYSPDTGVFGGDVTVDAGTIVTTGDNSHGIDTLADGKTNITVQQVSTSGKDSMGIHAVGYGDITINAGTVKTTGDHSAGIYATNNVPGLPGGISINADDVSTAGFASTAIRANAYVGPVSVHAGKITTSGYGSDGVYASSYLGDVSVDVGSLATTGGAGRGIVAYTGGATTINAGDVVTEGQGYHQHADAGGIKAVGAAVVVNANSVSTKGDYSAGIYANSNFVWTTDQADRDITVKAGTVSTQGFASDGIDVINIGRGGNTVIEVGDVVTKGDSAFGIFSYNAFGDTTIKAGKVLTEGSYSRGIHAEAIRGDITIDVNSVVTGGFNSTGISAIAFGRGNAIDITVNGGDENNISTLGDYSHGVFALSRGTVAVHNNATIETNGSIGANAIYAIAMDGITIDGAEGSVFTGGVKSWGILAYTLGGDVTITQQLVRTKGDQSVGVYANTRGLTYEGGLASGNIRIDVDAVLTNGVQSDALVAINSAQGGDIDIKVGSIMTTGNGSAGILAFANYGDVTVNAEDVRTLGETQSGRWVGDTYIRARVPTGIYARGENVTVNVTGAVSTEGHEASGIYAAALGGKAVIHANDVSAHGRYAAAVRGYSSQGGMEITTTGAITMSGARNAYGVLGLGNGAMSATNTGSIDVESDYGSQGIYLRAGAQAGNTITVMNSGTIRVEGTASFGVRANSASRGDIVITSTGTVSAFGDRSIGIAAGIITRSTDRDMAPITMAAGEAGPIITVAAADVYVSGGFSVGIGVNNRAGGVDIVADKVVAKGVFANGIVSQTLDLNLKVNSITAGGSGISVVTDTATIEVGNVTSWGTGIIAGTRSRAELTIHGNVVSQEYNAVELSAGSGTSVLNVLKSATLIGGGKVGSAGELIGPGHSVVIFGAEGSTINNAGSIINKGDGYTIYVYDPLNETGQPTSGNHAVTINNSGLIEGDLRLTNQKDIFVNSGKFVAMGDSDFGLGDDVLTNSGTLVVRNLANEARAAAAASVTLKGLERFENSGLIDLRSGAVGDTLTLTGNYVGSGNALLALDVNNGLADNLVIQGAVTGSTGIVLNQVGKDATLLSKPIELVKVGAGSSSTAFHMAQTEVGLVHYTLAYNAGSFGLTSQAGAGVYRLAKLGEGAQAIWDQSAQAWSSHMTELRDIESADTRVWGQVYGGVMNRDQSQAIGDTTYSLDYRQDFYGFQVGADLGGSVNDAGSTVFGVTAGYISSRQNFEQAGDRAKFDAVNLGAYASVKRGVFFANLLGQYDRHSIDANGKALEWSDKTSGNGYGLQGEIGARLGSDRFFVEPLASLAWQKTDIDRLELLGQSVEFGDLDGLTGRLGARIGGKARFLGTDAVFYAKGSWVHQFDGKASATLFSGGAWETVDGHAMGDYGQAALGVNILSAGPVSGFIEGNASFGSSAKGGGGRAGIRFSF